VSNGAAQPPIDMTNPKDELRSQLNELNRQLEVKDTQIAALLERVRETHVIIAKIAASKNE
jgi:hypothetical protein